MPVLTDTLADDIKALTADVKVLSAEFAKFRGSVETDLRYIHRIGGGLAALVLPLLGGLIWQAATLSNEVKHQGVRIDKLETKIDTRFDQIMQRLDQIAAKPKS